MIQAIKADLWGVGEEEKKLEMNMLDSYIKISATSLLYFGNESVNEVDFWNSRFSSLGGIYQSILN